MQFRKRQQGRHALVGSAAIAVAIGGGFSGAARGADVSWDAGSQNPAYAPRLWIDPENWAGDVVPTANDTAVFGPGPTIAGTVNLGAVTGPTGTTRDADAVRFTAIDDLYTLTSGVLRVNRIDVTGNAFSSANTGHVISSTVTTAGSNLTINVSNSNNAIPLNLNGNIGFFGTPPQPFAVTKEGSGVLYFRGAAAYSGDTIINNGTFEMRGATGRSLSTPNFNIRWGGILTINSVEAINNNRIDDAAAINLNGGMFNAVGAVVGPSSSTIETLGTIRFANGDSILQATTTAGYVSIESANLARTNRATGLVRGTNLGTFQSTPAARIRFATQPTADLVGGGGTSGPTRSIIPYLLGDTGTLGSGNRFVTYDTAPAPGGGVIGLRALNPSEWMTSFTDGATSTNNVHLNTAAVSNGVSTINSLFLEPGGGVSGSGMLKVTSGAIAGVGTSPTSLALINVNILDFGSREGVFHPVVHGIQVDSFISGTNGLTKSGMGELVLTANSSYSGNTTVNRGTITFAAPGAIGFMGNLDVYSSGPFMTAVKFRKQTSEFTRNVNNNIVLRGDALTQVVNDFNRTLINFDGLYLNGTISGEGGLFIDDGVTRIAGNNTYSGGTRVDALTHLIVAHDNALGTGPLTMGPGNGSVLRTHGGTRALANDVTAEGDFIVNLAGGGLTLSGDVAAAGASRVINVSTSGAPANTHLTLAGTLSAATPGTWALTGAGTLKLKTTTPIADRFHLHAGTLVVGPNALANDVVMGQTGIASNGTFLFLDTGLNGGADYAFDRNVTVNGGNNGVHRIGGQHAAGIVTFNGTITLGSEISPGTFQSRSATLFQPAGGTVVFNGAIGDPPASLLPANVVASGGGTVRLRGANTYRGTTDSFAGTTLHIESGASMVSKLYRANGGHIVLAGSVPTDSTVGATNNGTMLLNGPFVLGGGVAVGNNSFVTVAAGGVNTLKTTQLVIDPLGKLALNDNNLLVDYTGDSPESAIRQHVVNGRSGGVGITTTPGNPDDDKVLAVADNSAWNKTAFNGIPIDTSTVIGKYTYFGDANLDGKVTGDDYLNVDANLGTGDTWLEGDFNMNGVTTGDDYLAIDANLGKGTSDPLAFAALKEEMVAAHAAMFGEEYLVKLAQVEAEGFGASVVPEPSAGALLALGAMGLFRRRRRKN